VFYAVCQEEKGTSGPRLNVRIKDTKGRFSYSKRKGTPRGQLSSGERNSHKNREKGEADARRLEKAREDLMTRRDRGGREKGSTNARGNGHTG